MLRLSLIIVALLLVSAQAFASCGQHPPGHLQNLLGTDSFLLGVGYLLAGGLKLFRRQGSNRRRIIGGACAALGAGLLSSPFIMDPGKTEFNFVALVALVAGGLCGLLLFLVDKPYSRSGIVFSSLSALLLVFNCYFLYATHESALARTERLEGILAHPRCCLPSEGPGSTAGKFGMPSDCPLDRCVACDAAGKPIPGTLGVDAHGKLIPSLFDGTR